MGVVGVVLPVEAQPRDQERDHAANRFDRGVQRDLLVGSVPERDVYGNAPGQARQERGEQEAQ